MSSSLVIFLHSHRYDRVYQAVNLLLTASSMGRKCHLFLLYGALATFVDGSWDDVRSIGADTVDAPAWSRNLQRNFDLAGTPSLYLLLEKAREETGGLTICACSASTQHLGLAPADVKPKVDEIIGLATMLDIAAASSHALYI